MIYRYLKTLIYTSIFLSISISSHSVIAATDAFPTLSSLGESLFSDTRFSRNRTQSCATCHNPDHAFIDTRGTIGGAVSLGDDGVSLGRRNTPTASYAFVRPNFTAAGNNSRGGQFWDGRAGDLRIQAEGPFINPIEMNMPDKASVVARIQENTDYVEAFVSYFGADIFNDTDAAYTALAQSIAEFERSNAFAPIDSKFDRAINGTYTLTNAEQRGQNLFFANNVSCIQCHDLAGVQNISSQQMFTNFEFFNIGTPRNGLLNVTLSSQGQHADLVADGDQGLFDNPAITNNGARGRFKTPTLRNVAVTAPYMHNGVFSSLQAVIEFYDRQGGNDARTINPDTGSAWGAAETPQNISNGRLRMRDLSDQDVNDLECFLRTLTDQKYEGALPALRAGLNCS